METTKRLFAKANVQELADTNYMFLKGIGNQSQIIGIGEATHGSREFNELRLNFFKYLVRECNYRLFFIESNFSTNSFISKYVENGVGDPTGLLENTGSWLWSGTDMLAIVEWMRAYNKDKPNDRKVRLIGIDMRNLSLVLVEIKQYFQAHKTPNQRKILNTIAELFKIDKGSKLYQQKLELVNDLIKNDLNAETNFSVETGDYLIHYLQLNLDEELQLRKKSLDVEKIGLRDQFMAANMLWLCRYSKSSGKGIFAAHNGHVAKFDSPVYESSGQYLKKSLGGKYFGIYVDFAHGTTEAVDVQSGHLSNCIISGSSDAFSYNLDFDHRKSFFMNLRTAGNQVKNGLNQSLLFNGIGAVYNDDSKSTTKLNLIKQFDGYIYLPAITAKVPVKVSLHDAPAGK